VEEDPAVAKILDFLPKANCGACGSAGCAGFARALAGGGVDPSKCTQIAPASLAAVCGVLGIETPATVRRVARVRCHGGKNAVRRFDAEGVDDCRQMHALVDTNLECAYGCVGLGTCVRACPYGAIAFHDGVPSVDEALCTTCGKCVAACPKELIALLPKGQPVYVGCSTRDRGQVVMRACAVGCIACGKCVKVCPKGAINLVDNLAIIDYDLCDSCGACIPACPRTIIVSAGGSGTPAV